MEVRVNVRRSISGMVDGVENEVSFRVVEGRLIWWTRLWGRVVRARRKFR